MNDSNSDLQQNQEETRLELFIGLELAVVATVWVLLLLTARIFSVSFFHLYVVVLI